jgi:hypothetical protein
MQGQPLSSETPEASMSVHSGMHRCATADRVNRTLHRWKHPVRGTKVGDCVMQHNYRQRFPRLASLPYDSYTVGSVEKVPLPQLRRVVMPNPHSPVGLTMAVMADFHYEHASSTRHRCAFFSERREREAGKPMEYFLVRREQKKKGMLAEFCVFFCYLGCTAAQFPIVVVSFRPSAVFPSLSVSVCVTAWP